MHRRDLKVGDRVRVERPYADPRWGIVWMMLSDDKGLWVLFDDRDRPTHINARDVAHRERAQA